MGSLFSCLSGSEKDRKSTIDSKSKADSVPESPDQQIDQQLRIKDEDLLYAGGATDDDCPMAKVKSADTRNSPFNATDDEATGLENHVKAVRVDASIPKGFGV